MSSNRFGGTFGRILRDSFGLVGLEQHIALVAQPSYVVWLNALHRQSVVATSYKDTFDTLGTVQLHPHHRCCAMALTCYVFYNKNSFWLDILFK